MSVRSWFSAEEFRKWLTARAGAEEAFSLPFIASSEAHSSEGLERVREALALGARAATTAPEPLLWMATSGTTSGSNAGDSSQGRGALPRRWVGHSRRALLASARSVCQWLKIQPQDRWGRVLPLHHMGGLSIEVRSVFSGCSVSKWQQPWNAVAVHCWIEAEALTVISLVPAQLHDLVAVEKLPCPASLRAVVLGGDRVSSSLLTQASQLGWPVLPSYGMTETASMIACADPRKTAAPKGALCILPSVSVSIEDGLLQVQTASLFSHELLWSEKTQTYQIRAREPGAWLSEDRAELTVVDEELLITPLGRGQDFVKILGEGVNLADLDERAMSLLRHAGFAGEAAIVALPDERRGAKLVLMVTEDFSGALELWNSTCQPFERLTAVEKTDALPRTELGKLIRRAVRRNTRQVEPSSS